ncbi:MAG: hypothetical protein GY847_01345, partial [Proteobacteria bacterium]|nr:hypothetical protein [Pseudomonadota bacterium]
GELRAGFFADGISDMQGDVTVILNDTNVIIPFGLGLIVDDTGTQIPNAITALQGDVTDILEDTNTTIPGTITTLQGNVTDILEDTNTTIPGTITTLQGDVTDILVDGATNTAAILTAIPSISGIVDGVWDELISSHVDDGTFGGELATKADIKAEASTSYTVASSGSVIQGTLQSGTYADTAVRDNVYWYIDEHATNGLTVEAVFNIPDDDKAGILSLFGRYNGNPANSHYLELWLYNYEAAAWEKMKEIFMPGGNTSDATYEHEYYERHIDRTNNNEVTIRLIHNVTSYNASHDLYIDYMAISSVEIVTAADIADAVWNELAAGHTISDSYGEMVTDILEDTETTIPGTISTLQGNVTDILEDTETTIPGTITALQGDVTDILEDTETTIPGTITALQGDVTDILEDTETTIPGTISTLQGDVTAIQGDVTDILEDTETTIPAILSDLQTDLTAVLAGTTQLELDVTDILEDTETTIPASISALQGDVTDILEDTETTIPGTLTALQGDVTDILEDTETTIPGTISTLQGDVDSIADGVTTILVDTNELQTDWVDGGRLDNILDARYSAVAGATNTAAILAAMPSVSGIVDDIWNEVAAGHTTDGTFGGIIEDVREDVSRIPLYPAGITDVQIIIGQ